MKTRMNADEQESLPLGRIVRRFLPWFIIVTVVLSYGNSFEGRFVFDDYVCIVNNNSIRSFAPAILEASRPVTALTFHLNYYAGGLRAADYRLVNIIIHLLNALLVFALVDRTLKIVKGCAEGGTEWAAAAACLWAAHPLQTESVTYICQRYESLMGLFFLATIYCFARAYDSARPRLWYNLSIAACLAGMGTKEIMAGAPFVVLLYDYVFLSSSWSELFRKRWRIHLCLFLSIGLAVMLTMKNMYVLMDRDSTFRAVGVSSWLYLVTQSEVILHYLRMAVYPRGLCLDYMWMPAEGGLDVWPALAVVGAGAVASAVLVLRRSVPGFLGAVFFIILAPTSSVIPIADLCAEHRMYLPLLSVILSVFLLAGKGLELAERKKGGRIRFLRGAAVLTVVALVMVLVLLTQARNRDYVSEEVMWDDVIRTRPENVRAYLGKGSALAKRGRLDESEECFRKVLQMTESRKGPAADALMTEYAMALNNLGSIYFERGRFEEAGDYFSRALKISPRFTDAEKNLDRVRERTGRFPGGAVQ